MSVYMNFFKNISVIAMLCFMSCVMPKAIAPRGGETASAQPRVTTPKVEAVKEGVSVKQSLVARSYEQILKLIQTIKPTDQDYDLLVAIKTEINRQMTLLQPKSYDHILERIKTIKSTAQDYDVLVDIKMEIDRQMTLLQPKTRQFEPISKPVLPPRIIEQPRPQITPVQPTIYPYVPPRVSEQPKSQPVFVQSTVQKIGNETYLVPTDDNDLKKFGLCPLFEKKIAALSMDQEKFAQELRQEGYSEKDIVEFISSGVAPHYSFFRERRGQLPPSFGNENVDVNVPCMVALGKNGNWNRTLMQLKTLDQFKLGREEHLSAAMCGGLSLNNGRLIRAYGLTGNGDNLSKLHNITDAAKFLRTIVIGDWIDVKTARDAITKHPVELGVDGIDMSAVSTVLLFDSSLRDRPGELSFHDRAEFEYVQNVKKSIQEGLKRDNYVHAIVIGNIEAVAEYGHYFCFAIIKKGSDIQYIVLDTIPTAYHLQQGSHERDRLMFVIENIERGSSLIKVSSLYTNPEFMEPAKLSSENLLERALGRERMDEVSGGDFEVQIKQLNAFSKKLVGDGIHRGLNEASKNSLIEYRTAIDSISKTYGNVYSELRKLIVTRLTELR
jgi:hypothetical protein